MGTGRLLEGKARRLGHHQVRRGARVLRERAPEKAQHLVAIAQPAYARAGRLHHARRVDPGHPGLRPGQPHADEPRDQRVPSHYVPVGRIERGGVHPDQHVAGPTSGTPVSASRRTSGGPNLSWTIAFIRALPPVLMPRHGDRFKFLRLPCDHYPSSSHPLPDLPPLNAETGALPSDQPFRPICGFPSSLSSLHTGCGWAPSTVATVAVVCLDRTYDSGPGQLPDHRPRLEVSHEPSRHLRPGP